MEWPFPLATALLEVPSDTCSGMEFSMATDTLKYTCSEVDFSVARSTLGCYMHHGKPTNLPISS